MSKENVICAYKVFDQARVTMMISSTPPKKKSCYTLSKSRNCCSNDGKTLSGIFYKNAKYTLKRTK